MSVETAVTDELHIVAGRVQVPAPPAVVELVRRAERSRTRSRLRRAGVVGLVAAAVVTAVVIGTQVGRPTSAPQPVAPSPSYYAPGVPYVLNGRLFIDHEPQSGRWISADTVGASTVAIRETDRLAEAVVLRRGVRVYTAARVIGGPVISPGGTRMAWIALAVDEPGSPRILVVRDLDGDRNVGRLNLGRPTGTDVEEASLDAVDDDGTTYYNAPNTDHLQAWRPGGTPVPAGSPERTPEPVGFPVGASSVRLSPDHLWGAWLSEGASPGHGVLVLQKPGDPDSRFTVELPPTTDAAFVTWNSLTEVYAVEQDDAASSAQRVVACDIESRRCKHIAGSDGY